MTAISVVVARIIPSKVRKLRSLLERSEPIATDTASAIEALDFTQNKTIRRGDLFRCGGLDPGPGRPAGTFSDLQVSIHLQEARIPVKLKVNFAIEVYVADATLHLGAAVEVGPIEVPRDRRDTCDDAWLVEGLRQGTETAYEALIAEYQQPVYNLAMRLLSDPSDACDVVQEVFLKVFRKIGAFRGDSSLKTWVYRIAVNEAYNYKRWFGRHLKQQVGLEGEEEGNLSYCDRLPDPGRSPFDSASDSEQHQLVEAALARLNPTYRTAVVLRDIEELSYEEISEVLQVALGTVKSRILRGREALRKELAGRLEPEPDLHWTPQPAE